MGEMSMSTIRAEIKDRFYRTFTYQDVDRVPDISYRNYCEYREKKMTLIGK